MDAINAMDMQVSESETANMEVGREGPPQKFEFVSVKEESQTEEEPQQEDFPNEEFKFLPVKEEREDEKDHLGQVSKDIILKMEPSENEGDIQEVSEDNIEIEDHKPSIWPNYSSTDIPRIQENDLHGIQRQQLEYVSGSVTAQASENQEFGSYTHTDEAFGCKIVYKARKEFVFTCATCLARFPTKHSLIVHVFKHIYGVDPPSYMCCWCVEVFQSEKELREHMSSVLSRSDRQIEKVTRHNCEICRKSFQSPFHFKEHQRSHMNIHTGKKPYPCDVCGKRLLRLSGLQKHKRIHTNERPYSCDTCGKSFRQSGTLASHKRTHTGEKPYFCDICSKRFTHSHTLKHHKCVPNG